MTVVTTSRKPLPEVRSLARDMAFALGGRYFTRGKMGMSELLAEDRTALVISKQGRIFLLQVYGDDTPVATVSLSGFSVEYREGTIRRGLYVADRPVFDDLKDHIAVSHAEDLPEHTMEFDGTQRKHYILTLTEP